MPALSELQDVTRKQLLRALSRLGFRINHSGGKGSHCKATWRNEKCVTIPDFKNKVQSKYLLKEIEEISGVTWENIKEEL